MLKRQYYLTAGLVLLVALIVLNLPEDQAGKLKLTVGGLFLPLFGMAGSAQSLIEQTGNSLAPRSALLKEIEQLSKDSAALVHPPMIHRRPQPVGSKLPTEGEIVYPNGQRGSPVKTGRSQT